jgi:hypothetical protein
MILGEVEFTACRDKSGTFMSAPDDGARSNPDLEIVKLGAEDVVKKGDGCVACRILLFSTLTRAADTCSRRTSAFASQLARIR